MWTLGHSIGRQHPPHSMKNVTNRRRTLSARDGPLHWLDGHPSPPEGGTTAVRARNIGKEVGTSYLKNRGIYHHQCSQRAGSRLTSNRCAPGSRSSAEHRLSVRGSDISRDKRGCWCHGRASERIYTSAKVDCLALSARDGAAESPSTVNGGSSPRRSPNDMTHRNAPEAGTAGAFDSDT